jgi:hypothetical protein
VQVDPAALELELVDLALAVVLTAGLEREDLQVARRHPSGGGGWSANSGKPQQRRRTTPPPHACMGCHVLQQERPRPLPGMFQTRTRRPASQSAPLRTLPGGF